MLEIGVKVRVCHVIMRMSAVFGNVMINKCYSAGSNAKSRARCGCNNPRSLYPVDDRLV